MSCMCCHYCGRLIDSDDDPAAYVEPLDQWLCEPCRERDDVVDLLANQPVTTP